MIITIDKKIQVMITIKYRQLFLLFELKYINIKYVFPQPISKRQNNILA